MRPCITQEARQRQPVGLALHQGMVLTVQGHQAQDTAYRMRASRLIIDGTPYDL